MIKKIFTVTVAISMGFVLSAAPSAMAAKATSPVVIIAGPPTCCGSPQIS